MHDLFPPPENTLTVLSFGAGQDSSALLAMYRHNHREFRARYAPGDFLVLMSDPGDEHEETYQHVEYCRKVCEQDGIPFVLITNDLGFHSKGWPDLRTFFRTNNTIGSKAYPKTCTDRLKLQPFYNFLENYLEKRYGVTQNQKRGFYEFAARFGRVRVLIGLAAGEERRRADPSKNKKAWMRDNVEIVYPLIDYGLNRDGCQALLRQLHEPVPPPSNCKLCPWLSLEELEHMRRFNPLDLQEWITLERNKLERFAHMNAVEVIHPKTQKVKVENRNYGVWGTKTLPEKIEEARMKFADWSDERLKEYKFSHGHCMSTY